MCQLRRLLDDPLLVRSGGGMALTRRAEELVEPVQRWLENTSTLLEPNAFEPASLVRRFRVASTDFGVLAVVAPALPRMIAAAPGAAIDVVPLKGDMIQELAAGEVDLLVSGLDADPSQIHQRHLFGEDFCCIFRRGHPLGGPDAPIRLDEFLEWPHIAVTVGDDDFDRIDSRLGDTGKGRRVIARIPYFSASPGIIGSCDALVTLPSRAAWDFAAAHDLDCRPAPREIGGFDYRLLWHERTVRDPAMAWLRGILAHEFPSTVRMNEIHS